MKKKNHWILRLIAFTLLAAILNATVSLAAGAGTTSDPLVSLSYLNDTFLGQILTSVDDKIAQRNSDLAGELTDNSSGGDTFIVVTLQNGQTLQGTIGCEVMLRIGSAVCTATSSPGLVDETSAETIDNGANLVQNHLYLMTIENRGVKAVTATVKLLVRGSYTIS